MANATLFEKVAWDQRAAVADGYGNMTDGAWEEQFETRAHFTFLRGSESVIAARLEGRQPVVVRVRSSEKTERINTDWRMRDTRTNASYNVLSIIPSEDRRFIDITAETGTAE